MESSEQHFFEVRDLTVTYFPKRGAPIRALDGVNLDIRPGEVVGILGESGCGKSTLANVPLRLLPQHAKFVGKIFSLGRDLLKLTDKKLRAIRGLEISLIAQDPALALNPLLTTGLQIEEVLRAHFSLDRKQRRTRVTELLREVGFHSSEEIYSAYPHHLSSRAPCAVTT